MAKKFLNKQKTFETLIILRRSLIYQTKEFFQNSTLHGVRYIAETGRPIGEKFMWFCFTSIGAVTALVIIMSLWEKFQTNPTITGLDTDFHNQNVVFPTTVICSEAPFEHEKAYNIVYKSLANYDTSKASLFAPFLDLLTSLNFDTLKDAEMLAEPMPTDQLRARTIREWAFQAHISCENTLLTCKYRDEDINCCAHFEPIYTEHGFCYAFNSRFKSLATEDIKTGAPHDLYETDKKWALFFVPNGTARIYIFSNEEYFGSDFSPQIEWSEGQLVEVRISKKNTYTTDDARQLSIGQRKCIFHDEVKLQFFPDAYTFSSCMKECRMKKAHKLCKCNPPFYKPIPNIRECEIKDFGCLHNYRANITNIRDCLQCELSCSKTVFNIDKLIKNIDRQDQTGVLVEFLTWPIIRYKREVLFGWVDLLVSFGGIASLFLGFSLLSGVEIVYYFTLRACCMVYNNRQELYEIEQRIRHEPPPAIDLTLKIKSMTKLSSVYVDDDDKNKNVTEKSDKSNVLLVKPANGNNAFNPRQRNPDYNNYAKNLYKTPKIVRDTWQHGQYLP